MTLKAPNPAPIRCGPPGSDETALLGRLRRGDAAAFDEMVAIHQHRVARLARRLLGWPRTASPSGGDVEDVVQEVFLAALKQLPRFRGDSSLATWLAAITINQCRRHKRRWWRHWKRLIRLPVSTAAPADDPAGRDEISRRVRGAVADLPPAEREVIVLYYLEEASVAQIAELLGVLPGTIDVRLHRARKRLREILGER